MVSCKELGLGWIQDIVPNHMAVSGNNGMLVDVLENGESSRYINFFDIEWNHPDKSMTRCDGNHEDHATLHELTRGSREAVEIGPRIFFQPRGSPFTLPDGRVVLFVNGAKSLGWREEGVD